MLLLIFIVNTTIINYHNKVYVYTYTHICLIYVLASDHTHTYIVNIGDSRLPSPNQLSSFPRFNYGRPAKIAVSLTKL